MAIGALILLAAAGGGIDPAGQLIIDRNRADRSPLPEMQAKPEEKVDRAAIRISSDGTGIAIRRIVFRGTEVPAKVGRAAERFIGRGASPAHLREIALALSKAYAKTNVALYSIGIPEQDFAAGTLVVQIVEGWVAAATLEGAEKGKYRRARHHLDRLIGEKPLSRSRFERQISLMRDIPGFKLKSIDSAAGEDGAVALSVVPSQKRHEVSFAFNNRGTRSLGRGQFEATGKAYGAIVEGDQLSVTGAAASDFKRYFYGGAAYSMPLGYDGLSLGLSGGYLETRPKSSSVRGTAKVAGVSLSYPLIRAFDENLYLTYAIDGLNSDNAAFGNVISSERTRAMRASLRYAKVKPRRSVSGGFSLSKGLDFAGARADPLQAELRFFKFNADGSISQAIGKRFFVRVNAGGQWTRDRLPAAERFAVGGLSYGRAFESALLSADRGVGGSLEAGWQPKLGPKWEGSELYGFVDRAIVWFEPRPGLVQRRFTIASTGGGIRIKRGDKAELGFEAARAIDRPVAGFGDAWRFSVDWKLSF